MHLLGYYQLIQIKTKTKGKSEKIKQKKVRNTKGKRGEEKSRLGFAEIKVPVQILSSLPIKIPFNES